MGDGVSVPLEFSERPWTQALELSLGARRWGACSSGEGHLESISPWHLHLPQKGLRKLLQDVLSREMEKASAAQELAPGAPSQGRRDKGREGFGRVCSPGPNEPGPGA